MTESCCKLFRLKCFRKLSSAASSNGLGGGDEKNSSQLRQSCGGGECVVENMKDKTMMILPTSTLIDNGKKAAEDEILRRRHQRVYMYRSISEATGGTATSSEDDGDELDEENDVLYPLVDEKVNNEVEKATNSSLSLHSMGRKQKNVREFQQMRSRTEVTLYKKLFPSKKFRQKVNPLMENKKYKQNSVNFDTSARKFLNFQSFPN